MGKDECLELQARDIFGRPAHVTSCEMFRMLLTRPTWLFLGLVAAVFVATDAYRYREQITLLQDAVIWSVTIVLHVSFYVSLAVMWAHGQKRSSLPPIYLPVFSVTTFIVNNQITALHLTLYTGKSFALIVAPEVLIRGLALILIFEALYFGFVYPLAKAAVSPAEPVAAPRTIGAAGMSFVVDQILFMRGQAHYVEVVTHTETHRLRARLGDLVTQTCESDGIRAHRSHWISRPAIAQLVRDSGTDFILLKDGTRLPIARPRRDAVKAWLDKHVTEPAQPE